jgi:hypothetical protein
MKLKFAILTSILGFTGISNGAIYNINNVVNGVGDTLYANSLNLLSTGTITTIGVFPAGFALTSSLTDKAVLLSNYTTLSSGLTGGPSSSLGGNPAGYAEYDPDDQANILTGNALLGRSLYSFMGNASTLAGSTEFSLVLLGTILEDLPNENSYSSNPAGLTPIIGSLGTFNGDAGGGPGISTTLKTASLGAVPETSSALLGAIGALGLLRRRRN